MPSPPRTRLPALVLLSLPFVALAPACGRSSGGGGEPAAPARGPAADTAVAPRAPGDAAPAAAPDAGAARADGGARPASPLNVLFITIDSMRADMPWAGYPRPIAPNLTALEAQSVSYTRAYALSSYTSMSVGGFLAGRIPGEIPRSGFFFGHYPDSVTMLAERLRSAGVRTVSAHAHFYFRPGGAGFEQGFDAYEMVPDLVRNNLTDVDVTGDRHEALAERLLSDPANTAGRFFAWFHFMDPHDEYRPHPDVTPYGRRMRDRYDAEMTWTDRHVGRLIEFVRRQPWGARTAIVVSADHGEAFGEHGHYRHGFELWQELVRVPWFFAVPGAAPRRIDASRSHIDLAPTVLDLLGVAPAADLPGQSLVPEIYGAPAPERDVWVDLPRTSDNDRRRALVHGRHKVIAYGDDARFEVYDLAADPGEAHDLRLTDRATYDAMVARYRAAQPNFREVRPYAAQRLRGGR